MDITKVLTIFKEITALEIDLLDIEFDRLYEQYKRYDDEIKWWERFINYCNTGK
jgi:hypothetical protein